MSNRIIEFRCFVKDEGKMYPVTSLVQMNDEEGIRVFPNRPIGDGDPKNYLTSSGKVVLMQFTGLHDRDGKEVYHKDIMFTRISGKPYLVGTVEWSDEYARWYVQGSINPLDIKSVEDFYVQGNFYENPDLLTPSPKEKE